jgi:OmpA-OmpF porin, OOP family
MKTVFPFIFGIGLCINCHAQRVFSETKLPFKNTWSLNAYGGLSQFYGDLREYTIWPIQENNFDSQTERGTWHGGITLKYRFSPLFGLRADVGMGSLRGTKRRVYFSYFRANYRQADISAILTLTNLLKGRSSANRWAAEIYGGVGLLQFSATAYQLGSGITLRRSDDLALLTNTTAPKFTNTLAFPVGLTVSYALNSRFQAVADTRFNFLKTDLLDATLPLTGPNKMDSYAWGTLGLTYQWGR